MGLKIGKTTRDFQNIIDMHCHVLPGVDDGPSTMEESLEMLRIAEEQGITHIVCTPHYKKHHRPVGGEELKTIFEQLKAEAQNQEIHIKLYLGNEVFYFHDLEQDVKAGRILSMNQSRYLLTEFYPEESYKNIKNALYEVRNLGFFPVLAHIERYACLHEDLTRVEELKKSGIRLQVNAAAVTGEEGFGVRQLVGRLLKEQLVDYISTDAHSSGRRAPKLQKCIKYLSKKYDQNYVEKILYGNAAKDFMP